ncbi:FkbM family methyltransferase [Streptomyces sp. NPDC058471]
MSGHPSPARQRGGPVISAYLKSDEDHAAGRSTGLVLARESASCLRDATQAAWHGRGGSRWRLAHWMMRRFAGAAGTPLAEDGLLLFRIATPGGPAQIFIRRNQSDLLILWQIFLRRFYELNDTYQLTHPLRTLDTVVDLGGNTGLAAAYLSSRYRPRRLLTAEPIAESRAVLRRNAHLSRVPWIIDERAVTGHGEGPELEFAVSAFWDTCTAVPEVHELRSTRPWRLENSLALPRRTVEAVDVSSLLDQHDIDHIDLLKVDIEGSEAAVFATPQPWMNRTDRIVLEVHDKYIDGDTVRATMHEAGFCRIPPRVPDPAGFNPVELYVRRGVPA